MKLGIRSRKYELVQMNSRITMSMLSRLKKALCV